MSIVCEKCITDPRCICLMDIEITINYMKSSHKESSISNESCQCCRDIEILEEQQRTAKAKKSQQNRKKIQRIIDEKIKPIYVKNATLNYPLRTVIKTYKFGRSSKR